ncbi:MAG: hypothetical protein HC915_20590, partial [Anaerolineae bacterium]|nr:hypothetical protein [Anaerolineae bacterium]
PRRLRRPAAALASQNRQRPPPLVTSPPLLVSEFPFAVREPLYRRHLGTEGCDWLSVAGTVTSLLGQPYVNLDNLAVEVSGNRVSAVAFVGEALQFGPAGFEVRLGAAPRRGQFAVRLLGRMGEAVSDYLFLNTEDSCDRNVVFVEFVQNRDY